MMCPQERGAGPSHALAVGFLVCKLAGWWGIPAGTAGGKHWEGTVCPEPGAGLGILKVGCKRLLLPTGAGLPF